MKLVEYFYLCTYTVFIWYSNQIYILVTRYYLIFLMRLCKPFLARMNNFPKCPFFLVSSFSSTNSFTWVDETLFFKAINFRISPFFLVSSFSSIKFSGFIKGTTGVNFDFRPSFPRIWQKRPCFFSLLHVGSVSVVDVGDWSIFPLFSSSSDLGFVSNSSLIVSSSRESTETCNDTRIVPSVMVMLTFYIMLIYSIFDDSRIHV